MHGVFKSTSIMILKTVPCYLMASRECWADITDELGVSEPGDGLFSNRKTFNAPAPTNPSNTVNAQVAPPGLQVSNLRVHLKVKNSQIPIHFGLRWWLSDGKESSGNVGDPGSIPGLGRSPGEGNGYPLQYSCLENPMDGGAWRATSPWGHTKSDTPERLGTMDLRRRASPVSGVFPPPAPWRDPFLTFLTYSCYLHFLWFPPPHYLVFFT